MKNVFFSKRKGQLYPLTPLRLSSLQIALHNLMTRDSGTQLETFYVKTEGGAQAQIVMAATLSRIETGTSTKRIMIFMASTLSRIESGARIKTIIIFVVAVVVEAERETGKGAQA